MTVSVQFHLGFSGGHASRKIHRTGDQSRYRLYHHAQEKREHPEQGIHGPKTNILHLQKEIPDIHPSKGSKVSRPRM